MSLIDLSNIPGNQISGLDDEMLAWITEESNSRYIEELSASFVRQLDNQTLNEIPEDVENELDRLEMASVPKTSMKQMNEAIQKFRAFLCDKLLSNDLQGIPIALLDTYLRYFYSELKTKEGKFYAPASLVCIRAGIQRFFSLNRPNVNIISDQRFVKSNRMLKTMVSRYKTSNQPKSIEKYPAIEKDDLLKIRSYFDRSNAEVLQEETMFNLIYHLALRGRETLPLLSKDSLSISKDASGNRFLHLNHELLSKNAKASLKVSEYEDTKKARIYENTENLSECPVACFEMYLSKIQSTSSYSLFPKPHKSQRQSVQWYTDKQTVGKNTIDNLMSGLSKKLCLSKKYTNHCLRVTHITVLKENGFSNSEIAVNTGHKNTTSIERYHRKRRDLDFQRMSTALHIESSSRRVNIIPVGKKGKIEIEETTREDLATNPIDTPVCINFNFQGNFNKCSFHLPNMEK